MFHFLSVGFNYLQRAILIIGGAYLGLLFLGVLAMEGYLELVYLIHTPAPATVAEMRPIQLYGVVMFAIVVAGLFPYSLRALYPSLHGIWPKITYWFAIFMMVGAPTIIGILSLRQ